ncbi:Sec7-domain-containing protein [Violaceomyces palustris]|uniref:Sec7-domain-containing protein n=1 Tax=Violaceomyces palustris TaxID=1673888 RepID=A0ACD0NPL6_9BASI|nr:Sec7-domain-containing protein [Violaceomyces palustris]
MPRHGRHGSSSNGTASASWPTTSSASAIAPTRLEDDRPPHQDLQPTLIPSHVPIQSQPLHLVRSEITAVTTAMRKNARWAPTSFPALSNLASYAYSPSFPNLPPSDGFAPHPSSSSSSSKVNSNPLASPSLGVSMGLRNTSSNQKGKQALDQYLHPRDVPRSDQALDLLNGFALLKSQLRQSPDLSSFPLPLLLSPFLGVILSPRTTGPITSAALQAVHKFLTYRLVHLSAPGARVAVADIAHATSHCRFEASEASADEQVLLRILAVMRELICEPALAGGLLDLSPHRDPEQGLPPRQVALADCLSDESICEMMETGLSMCCQMRLSDLLRSTAEQSMTAMIRSLFSRLQSIPTTADETYSSDPNAPSPEPEHATLAAEPVGEDPLNDEKRLRRMTMPDPTSRAFPAAAVHALKDLKELGEVEDEGGKGQGGEAREGEEAKDSEVRQPEGEAQGTTDLERGRLSSSEPGVEGENEHATEAEAGAEQAEAGPNPDAQQDSLEVLPYGLPACKEVLRVVVSLLDPHNPQHTDTMRLLGLSMLCNILEVSGRSVGRFPTLRSIIQDSACKYLFQLARSETLPILSLALRCISNLFETMGEHLKLQTELFLTFALDRLAPTFPVAMEPWNGVTAAAAGRRSTTTDANGRATPDVNTPPPPPPAPPMPKGSEKAPAQGEARELMLEALASLFVSLDASQPSDLLVDLYVNFDCDIDCENLYESVVRFLCRAVHASNPQYPSYQDSSQLLALDTLLTFVASMAARQEYGVLPPAGPPSSSSSSYQALAEQKSRKASILEAASRFNAKPKDGLAYLEEEGLIDASGEKVPREQSIASFLKDCPRLDKKLLGDYISRPANADVLDAFIGLFDFGDKPIADALREMLESFRLPGEAQQIDRITEKFSKKYFAAKPPGINSEDAVYVLAFSIIMLNTDLHNPQNKKQRMSLDDYKRNLRGVNDGKDFDPDYLSGIYDSIRRREIVMPEEHAGQLGFDYAWKELLRKSRTAGTMTRNSTAAFDRDMFQTSWRPIFSSIAYAFSTFRDEHMVERAISGIRQCAILASKFGMTEMFDFMVHSLAGATGLLDASVPQGPINNAIIEVEGQPITVSPLSVRFGVNFKGQLAAVVLFTIANGNGDAIRTGWSDIFEIFKNLFANTLLPAPMLEMFDFQQQGSTLIPLKPKKVGSGSGGAQQDPRTPGAGGGGGGGGGGLLSTLSSYLLSPYSSSSDPAPFEATEEDVETSLCTVDCVASCKIDELYDQIKHLDHDSLLWAVQALKDLADNLTVDKVAARQRALADGSLTPTQQVSLRGQLPYEPSSIFAIETMINVATSPVEARKIQETWPIALEHISAVLRTSKSYHPLVIEREVVGLLRLVDSAAEAGAFDQDSIRDQLFLSLDLVRTLAPEVRSSVSQQLLAGLTKVMANHPNLARSQTEWGMVLALISENSIKTTRDATSVRLGFEAVKALVVGGQGGSKLTTDNYVGIVTLLEEFASGSDTRAWKEIQIKGGGATGSSNPSHQQRRTTLTEKKEMEETEKVKREVGTEALDLLESFKDQVPRLIRESNEQDKGKAWRSFWIPLLSSLARQCVNAHRPVRQVAITHLQRALLAKQVVEEEEEEGSVPGALELKSLFDQVLFPMLEELLQPNNVYRMENATEGIQEMRIRSSALVCKLLLHLLNRLAVQPETLKEVWLTILDFSDRMIHSGPKDQLSEAIPENLKNVLLVMSATGTLLAPPPPPSVIPPSQEAMWKGTWERISTFLPGLKEEIFP